MCRVNKYPVTTSLKLIVKAILSYSTGLYEYKKFN